MDNHTETSSGIPLEPVYGPGDRGTEPPGQALTVHPRQLRQWLSRQAVDVSPVLRIRNVEESNRRYRYLLEQGGTGLSVALDLPTQCGYDSDDPEFGEEVGRVGVAIDTLADAEILFDGIPLDKISTSFTIMAAPRSCWRSTWRPPSEKVCRAPSSPGPSRTTSSRNTPRVAPGSGHRTFTSVDCQHHRVLRGRSSQIQRNLGGRCALS